METELGLLEKQVEEAELITGSTKKDVIALIERLKQTLRNYCLQPEHADEVIKRPIEQLNGIINFVEKVSDDSIQEKIQSINAQTPLITHRLDVMKGIEDLKSSIKVDDLTKVVKSEDKIDEFTENYTKLNVTLAGLNSVHSKQQKIMDSLFNYIDEKITELEQEKAR
ncbi:unnamed protein product [Bursaphelenchus okinawaensis]|uniref:Uncharacterized protein n=1 Tax=Bursaphelenchus okinawaensis TaxID=465554 RepID=A0A811JUF0_9BILA|nr:unnamed protein product [Bursaphelenchus okinawaensis]CAG9083024.1 unnamed protein product [Bursaphelenchus okinawaensis]